MSPIVLDVTDLSKILAAFGSFGLTLAGGLAFFKPFAAQWLALRLERAKRRAEIEDETARARAKAEAERDGHLKEIATGQEKLIAVLENVFERLDHLVAASRRMESHLGITLNPSTVPPEPAPVQPRRQLTDPDLRPTTATRPPVSSPVSSPIASAALPVR